MVLGDADVTADGASGAVSFLRDEADLLNRLKDLASFLEADRTRQRAFPASGDSMTAIFEIASTLVSAEGLEPSTP